VSTAPSFWRGEAPLVLASGSATRLQLLEAAGLPVETVRPQVDEREIELRFLQSGGAPDQLAAALAEAKALAVSPSLPGRYVLAADQTLVSEGRLFHKPETAEAANRQLAALAGRPHRLTSAFAIARDGAVLARDARSAELSMRPLAAAEIERYVALAGPAALASVGAYQIEGPGIHLFEAIDGDHSTILGLPMLAVLAALRGLDLVA
jgi:septum formation protein